MWDTGSWLGGCRHGADGMCGCRWEGARAAGGDRGRPQPATKARRAGAHRARLSGSEVGAAPGAKHRRQSADGVALATALCRSRRRGFVEGMGYAIRLPANRVLQEKIGYLLKRPVGRPPHEVRRYPVADRPVAGTARDSMRGASVRCDKRRRERYALMQPNQGVSAPQSRDRPVRTPPAHEKRDFTVARDAQRG